VAQNFDHRPAFGEFIDDFVEVADFPHQGVFDFLNADAADESFDGGAS
jgi:hypothetical protein